jgi:transcriptional regulator with XRE-family HTH domain
MLLRKARNHSRRELARLAGVSEHYLRKIETGERPGTPAIFAALARALKVSTQRIYGQPFIGPVEQGELLNDLRAAIRRYRLPQEDVPDLQELRTNLADLAELRAGTKYMEMLRIIPKLLEQATATALASDGDSVAWEALSDAYGCAYSVAHRLGQPDLAEMIVSRQSWAAQQTYSPNAEAGVAWTEAGVFQSAGDYASGLAVVDRGIVKLETSGTRDNPDRLVSLGSLHLRGVVLASRHRDRVTAQAHSDKAYALAEALPQDADQLRHNLTFGTANTILHDLASKVELDKPDKANDMATPLLDNPPAGLRPSRVAHLYIDTARARLALQDNVGAEESLQRAFNVAPQMTEVHPMAREVLRVLFLLHQRSRPELMAMARRTGLAA